MLLVTDGRLIRWVSFVFSMTGMEWSGFSYSRVLLLGHVGSPGGCQVTSSLGTWWEFGLGLMGVLGVLVLGFFLWTLIPVRLGAG